MLPPLLYSNIQLQSKPNHLNFTGSYPNIKKITSLNLTKQKINLYLDNENNKNVYRFLEKTFNRQPKDVIQKIYLRLLDANGIVKADTANILKQICNDNINIFSRRNNNENIFGIINLASKSKYVKDILVEAQAKLKDTKSSDLKFCLEHSFHKSDRISLENFKNLADLAQNERELLKYYRIFRDNNKVIRNDNIDFVRLMSARINDRDVLVEYAKVCADNNGVIPNGSAKNLDAFFRKYPKSNSSSILTYCIERVKNPDYSINWDCMKTFYNVRSKICHINKDDPHNIFNKILCTVKDRQGEFVPEFVNQVRTLMDENFLGEISYILRAASKSDGHLDLQFLDAAKKILKTVNSDERINISKYLMSRKDNQVRVSKAQTLEKILDSGIKSNILSIENALQNPEGTTSQRGLDLIKTLRKNSHHQIEEELADILKLCRDNTNYLNDANIAAVKSIQAQKPPVKLSTLLSIIRNCKTGEVEPSKAKTLKHIINQLRSKRFDSNILKDVIKYSTDRNGDCNINMMQILINIYKSGNNIYAYKDMFPAFRDFAKYANVKSYAQLNLQQKRDIMRKIKNHKDELQNTRFRKFLDIKILPNNDSDYCVCLARLSHSIGIDVKPLDQKLISGFFNAMTEMSNPNSEFMKIDFNKSVPKLDLSYPLKDFQKDVWEVIKNLSYSDRIKAIDYFGFELKQVNNKFVMNGFPSVDISGGRLAKIKDTTVQDAISKITPYVIDFTQKNKVQVANNPKLSNELNDIIAVFPEFLTTVGKPQHITHDYTLDIHLLKVLQEVFKNPEYQKLSDTSKKQLQISALLHDLTKSAGEVDKYHPDNSAFDIYYLLDKFNMDEKDKLKIYHIIKNHAWLARYNKSSNQNYVAKDLAFELRQDDAFKMISILAEADLKGIQKYNAFYNKYSADLINAQKKIFPIIHDLQKTAINLPQTKIPKISDINHNSPYVSVINKDGIKNTVIWLKKGIDLKNVGFDENVTLPDLNILVHGLDNKDSAAMFQALGMINSNALLSSSYINYAKGNWRVFRQQGFVLKVPSVDIHAGYWRDFGSGYKKEKQDLFSKYLFSNNFTRTYFSYSLKKELKLSDDDYISLIGKIADLSITELDKYYPKVADAYRKIFTDMDVSKRSYGRNYNEILVSRPKIQALFSYGQNPENISAYLRRYAERNNIPILSFN